MKASYKKLWKLLIDKEMNKTDLHNATGICSATLAKMAKGRDVTVSTLTRICEALECNIGDIVDVDVATGSTKSKRRIMSRQRV